MGILIPNWLRRLSLPCMTTSAAIENRTNRSNNFVHRLGCINIFATPTSSWSRADRSTLFPFREIVITIERRRCVMRSLLVLELPSDISILDRKDHLVRRVRCNKKLPLLLLVKFGFHVAVSVDDVIQYLSLL